MKVLKEFTCEEGIYCTTKEELVQLLTLLKHSGFKWNMGHRFDPVDDLADLEDYLDGDTALVLYPTAGAYQDYSIEYATEYKYYYPFSDLTCTPTPLEIPPGYELDLENSTPTNIVLKPTLPTDLNTITTSDDLEQKLDTLGKLVTMSKVWRDSTVLKEIWSVGINEDDELCASPNVSILFFGDLRMCTSFINQYKTELESVKEFI